MTGGKTILPFLSSSLSVSSPHTQSTAGSTDSEDENEDRRKQARYELYQQQEERAPTKPLKSQGFRYPLPVNTTPSNYITQRPSSHLDEEMEEGEITDEDDTDSMHKSSSSSSFAY